MASKLQGNEVVRCAVALGLYKLATGGACGHSRLRLPPGNPPSAIAAENIEPEELMVFPFSMDVRTARPRNCEHVEIKITAKLEHLGRTETYKFYSCRWEPHGQDVDSDPPVPAAIGLYWWLNAVPSSDEKVKLVCREKEFPVSYSVETEGKSLKSCRSKAVIKLSTPVWVNASRLIKGESVCLSPS